MEQTLPAEAPEFENSAVTTESVPKTRFDGLMSRYHKDRETWERERADLLERLERLESQVTRQVEEEDPVPDQTVEELKAMLLEERLERTRQSILQEYPDVKPFVDLIVADDPNEMRTIAAELSNRLQQVLGSSEPTQSVPQPTPEDNAPPPAEPTPPVEPAPPAGPAVDADVQAALQAGDFSAYLAALAKKEAAQG